MGQSTPRGFLPLKFALPQSGDILIVESVHDAVEALAGDWPDKTGSNYARALQVSIDAMTDRASPDNVREALIKAAEEAGMSVVS